MSILLRSRTVSFTLAAAMMCAAILLARSDASAQRGAAPPGPPRSGRDLSPIDIAGTWVAVVTEDWRWRMVTPPKGEYSSVPLNAEGRKVADTWDISRDNASGSQCKAFGVGGIMRQPGRIRISWQDDQTLKLEFDAGTQTRLLHFDRTVKPPAERTWQGFSVAQWEGPGVGRGDPSRDTLPGLGRGPAGPPVPGGGGQGLRGGPPPRGLASINRGGSLRVVTTNFREGYLRKNGVPYSEQASITEYFHRLPQHPNGDHWLHVVTIVDDPRYLSQPFYTSTHFRLEPDASKFNPTPCQTAPPLPVKTAAR
jgi:hypothetical protein